MASKSHEPIGGRVLVIEDQPDIRELIAAVLRPDGHTVTFAEDGEAGLAMARADPPDVVLLDLMMPKLHGYQVLQALRANPATANIPVVAVTGESTLDREKELRALGVTETLVKPYKLAQVTEILDRMLNTAAK